MLDETYLHPLSDFIGERSIGFNEIKDCYEGICPNTGVTLRLPRTSLAEAIAFGLMQQLDSLPTHPIEGKMYGILVVELPTGEKRVLKAFSGLLQGQRELAGWVPPIPGRDKITLSESLTLSQLEQIKLELIQIQQLPEKQEYQRLLAEFAQKLTDLNQLHQHRKAQRQAQRSILEHTLTGIELEQAIEALNEQSRQDGIERKLLKRERDSRLNPLKTILEQAEQRQRELKQQRREISGQLQTQMHAVYRLTNFAGQSFSLQELSPINLPTGTGDCCAPKLLHYAATHQLRPITMAEFWWGTPTKDKIPGQFYQACRDRCQPILGFLLSGLPTLPNPELIEPLTIIYEDEWIIAVDKPAGLLSVPGRTQHDQDSVLSRLQHQYLDGEQIKAVHRLDQDTSGILLLTRSLSGYRTLSQQFQQRQVKKLYEAILAGHLQRHQGEINLPLWGDPQNRPYQSVNPNWGKPSLTYFQVMDYEGDYTRVEFKPVTGRTHQLRVHAADAQGLGIPILGDRLYGNPISRDRLHLHAKLLHFQHPHLGHWIELKSPVCF